MTQEALKLALVALDVVKLHYTQNRHVNEAIAAIKEALAQTQEPVGQLLEEAFGRGQVMWFNKPKDQSMLYTTPPQRTWVGLTEQQRNDIEDVCEMIIGKPAFDAIEAKLKEKNT